MRSEGKQAPLFGAPIPSRAFWHKNATPGLLKSAVQKAIRRGELGLLRWAVDLVWQRPEGRAWLCRRLPILAAEEVWPCVGWAGYVGRLAQGSLKHPEGEATARALLEGAMGPLALSTKNKDAGGVQVLAQWTDTMDRSSTALAEALEANAPVRATAIALDLLARKGDPWQILLHWTTQHGTVEAGLLIQEAKVRYKGGALEGDLQLLAGSAVLAALGPEQVAIHRRFHPIEAVPTPPPWTVADMHTDPGRRVLTCVAQRRGIPRETLSNLWFYFESALLDREESAGWWPRAVELELHRLGYPSVQAAREAWEHLRLEVQAQVEAALPHALAEVERWAAGENLP